MNCNCLEDEIKTKIQKILQNSSNYNRIERNNELRVNRLKNDCMLLAPFVRVLKPLSNKYHYYYNYNIIYIRSQYNLQIFP